jgi:hypothetical protein
VSWKRRILELSLAGGLIAGAGGCGDNGPNIPLCNANPGNRDLSVPSDMATPRDLTSQD